MMKRGGWGRPTPFAGSLVVSSLMTLALVFPAFGQNAPEVPPNATLKVRVIENLNSEVAKIGDDFHGTLDEALIANDHEIYPKGADVDGRIVDVHKSGRLSEPGELDLVLSSVRSGNRTSSLHVQPLIIKGESHAKSNASKIGGGAALGAIIGAIAGGGKGAAVGAAAGGAAGTGAAAVTGAREAKVASEQILTFVTVASSEVASTATPTQSSAPQSSSAQTSSAQTSSSPAITEATNDSNSFSLRDRRVLKACLSDHASELPPGTMVKAEMPSGAERELHRDGTVPAEIEQQVQSLPIACVRQLPTLPNSLERVVYAGHVMLIDENKHILDIFDVD